MPFVYTVKNYGKHYSSAICVWAIDAPLNECVMFGAILFLTLNIRRELNTSVKLFQDLRRILFFETIDKVYVLAPGISLQVSC